MILHADRYFEHQYDSRLDMVCVKWPDIEGIYLPEIFNSVKMLLENIKNYYIRNLLVDASHTKALITYEDVDKVVHYLYSGLKDTRLEKLARVESANQQRELDLRRLVTEMNLKHSFETRVFKDTPSAVAWLTDVSASVKHI